MHFGSHELYPDGSKVEVSVRPDHLPGEKAGLVFKPSHPGKVKNGGVKYQRAFDKAVAEIDHLIRENPKVRQKMINQINNNLFKQFPDKGLEWKKLRMGIENFDKICH